MAYIRAWLIVLLIIPFICIADPILMDEEVSFHKLDVNASDEKQRAVCRECHMLAFTKEGNASPLWLKGRQDMQVHINNLVEDTPEAPDPFSLACLSCHDGSMAALVLNAPLSPCGIKPDNGVSDPGNNHPVFVKYSAYKSDLHPRHKELLGKWIDAIHVDDLLRDEKVVCISCHVPHHNSTSGYLRTTQQGSALCTGCHNK